MDPSTIKDPTLRERVLAADRQQNGWKPKAPNIQQPMKAKKRVRQDGRPLLNKLETEFYDQLLAAGPNKLIRAQAMRYKLANGVWYKPDFTCANWRISDGETGPVAWEVKGPRAFRGGFENLKVAATRYPEVRWLLVWKDQSGQWQEQHILP